MSLFSQSHLVTKFDAKSSSPLTGQRLAKVKYKTTAKTPAKFPSICASVPFIDTKSEAYAECLPALTVHIRAMLENAQDGIIRSLYESSDGTLSQVVDSDISIHACIAYLDAESTGGRLTKELIDAWFTESVAESVSALIVEKLGYSGEMTEEQETKVSRHVAGFKDMYSALAGGKTLYNEKQCKNLLFVFELIDSDDLGEKLKARLHGMMNKPKIDDMLELY